MRSALITGASSGIGQATALRLASSGWRVLAGIRDPIAGEKLQSKVAAGAHLIPIELDVTDPAQISSALERVNELAEGKLDALVNNAGAADAGPLETLPLERLRALMEVNFFGQVALTQALVRTLRSARGRIVFVSSVGGLVTTPFGSPYHASKYALEAVGNSLRSELFSSGIQVTLIEPGSVATPIWDKGVQQVDRTTIPEELREFYGHIPAAMTRTLEQTATRGIPAERVAERIERALNSKRMRARYLIGRDAHAMVWASRLLPDLLFDRIVRRALGV